MNAISVKDKLRVTTWAKMSARSKVLLLRASKADEALAAANYQDIELPVRQRLRAVCSMLRAASGEIADLAAYTQDESGPVEPAARVKWWREMFGE